MYTHTQSRPGCRLKKNKKKTMYATYGKEARDIIFAYMIAEDYDTDIEYYNLKMEACLTKALNRNRTQIMKKGFKVNEARANEQYYQDNEENERW